MGTCNFARHIVRRQNSRGATVYAHWYNFLRYIAKHPNCTRKSCSDACKPVGWWDQWATNTWSEMVKQGFVTKERCGRSFIYNITREGLTLLEECVMKEYDRKHPKTGEIIYALL